MEQEETMKCTQREYVKKELLAYLELEKPGFAVLLHGSWGCGKTYLIKEIKKELECKGKDVTGHPLAKSLTNVWQWRFSMNLKRKKPKQFAR